VATLNAAADGAEAGATSAEAAAASAEAAAAAAETKVIETNDETQKKLAIASRQAATESRLLAIEARNTAKEARENARLLASSVVSDPPQHTIMADDRVALPTQKQGEFLAIEARINGRGPFRLIVDTGTAGLVLSAEAAKRGGLEPRPEPNTETLVINGVIATQVARVDRFESGGLLLKGFSAGVATTSDYAIIRQELGADIDGFLGIAPLADVLLEMDFPHGQVSVRRRGQPVYLPGCACRYTLGEGDALMVQVAVGGNVFPALFDTGSDSVLGLPRLDSIPLRFPWLKQDRFIGGMGTRIVRSESSQLAGDARIGPVTLHNPPVENGHASIGVKALGQWKIVLDQHDQLLYFLGPEPVANWATIKLPEL
jgi:predicted aspartyl protease